MQVRLLLRSWPERPAGEGPARAVDGGGLYAVARHVGPYDDLDEKFDYLYGPWLESSGYPLREAPLYNHYLTDPETLPPEEWQTNVCLPIANGEDL